MAVRHHGERVRIGVIHRNAVLGEAIALVLRDAGHRVMQGEAAGDVELLLVGVEASREGANAVMRARQRWGSAHIVAIVGPHRTPRFEASLKAAGATRTIANIYDADELLACVAAHQSPGASPL